ncbi:helix-turn-helix domain-containing protein [Amycolatopsis pigmentata]|uniref:Helix-turn-helix domain-containing protein n=1 Tax=Amycolatopsis pigmentata TaxID=450801 RepID=A0ABW5G0D3_9PSEU
MDHFYEQFGARIRRVRQQAGINQEELGHRVGLNRSSISNVEKGRQRVPLHMIMEFAEALDVPAATLLPGDTTQLDPLRGVPQETRPFVEDILHTAGETSHD